MTQLNEVGLSFRRGEVENNSLGLSLTAEGSDRLGLSLNDGTQNNFQDEFVGRNYSLPLLLSGKAWGVAEAPKPAKVSPVFIRVASERELPYEDRSKVNPNSPVLPLITHRPTEKVPFPFFVGFGTFGNCNPDSYLDKFQQPPFCGVGILMGSL